MAKKMMGGPQMPMSEGMEEEDFSGGSETKVNLEDYPDISVGEGDTVEGSFSGTVVKVDGKMATIKYDELELKGGNSADRALSEMGGGME